MSVARGYEEKVHVSGHESGGPSGVRVHAAQRGGRAEGRDDHRELRAERVAGDEEAAGVRGSVLRAVCGEGGGECVEKGEEGLVCLFLILLLAERRGVCYTKVSIAINSDS